MITSNILANIFIIVLKKRDDVLINIQELKRLLDLMPYLVIKVDIVRC